MAQCFWFPPGCSCPSESAEDPASSCEPFQPPGRAAAPDSLRMHRPLLPVGMLAKTVFPTFLFQTMQRKML